MATAPASALDAAFDPQANAIGFLRLAAAGLVLISHTFTLGGFGIDPLAEWTGHQANLGNVAVMIFFVLSGFLVTRSLLRASSIRDFVRRRALRILPGYWVCLAVTALGLGAVLWWHDHGSIGGFVSTHHGPIDYLQRNWLILIRQPEIGGILVNSPFDPTLNGSLWTLIDEVRSYAILALLGWFGLVKHRCAPVLIGLAAFWWFASFTTLPFHTGEWFPLDNPFMARNLLAFTLGALICVYGGRIPVTSGGALVAVALIICFNLTQTYLALGIFPLSYLVLYLAVKLPFRNVNSSDDISYGVYIYAFPVQQALSAFGVQHAGIVPYFIASTILTVLLASLSWRLVERPFMRRR